jgi:hypothetical protein
MFDLDSSQKAYRIKRLESMSATPNIPAAF